MHKHAEALLTDKCTRTRPLSDAGEDVRYLDNLTTGRPQAVVYGDVFRGIKQPDGSATLQALAESFEIVAVSTRGRRSVVTWVHTRLCWLRPTMKSG
jgi:hypothetical protein